jgi:glycosyltransferase involved in cell wall biosynthesis
MAAKMREVGEIRYFTEVVEPLLGPDAVYLGEVPHERKLELLGGATALLFPIRWNEPFGLVMLEAMACGTPVLAFPEGAAPEVVEDGRTGFLCDDEEAMVAALRTIDSIERSACRAAVEGYFSTGRMVDDHVALFESLVARA